MVQGKRWDLAGQLAFALLTRSLGAHAFGAVAVFAYLEITLGAPPGASSATPWGDIVRFAVLFAGTAAVVTVFAVRSFLRSCRWAIDGREPTAGERRRALQEPWRQALLAFPGWVVAVALYLAIDLAGGRHDLAHNLRVLDAVLLGGVATSVVSYLLLERAFRPVLALALAGAELDRPASLGIRPRLLLTWAMGSGVPLLGLLLAPSTHEPGARFGLGTAVVVLAAAGLAAGFVSTVSAARGLAEPVDGVRDALARVEAGDLSAEVAIDDGGDIGMLQRGFNRMVAGLRERERLHDLFGRHVGVEVAAHALEQGTGLGGEQREASVLFVDLIGSSALAEVLAPEEVVATLNAFFGAVVDAVAAEGGWVNKFEGDGALCVFGAPAHQPDHAARALRAARSIQGRVAGLRAGHPGLDAGVGVSSGAVVAGNVGTEARYEYTVIGRPVNEAARLSDLAKGRGARVLASAAAIARAGDEAGAWVGRGSVALRGHSQPTGLFEPGIREPTPAP